MRGWQNMTVSILTIAGSDSCSGAGLQIDLKTAAAHGVYATCAVTAVTAQNTHKVEDVRAVDPELVAAQIETVFEDIPPKAIKIGMLGSTEVARAVSETLAKHGGIPVVLDPVLVATAGGTLTDTAAFDEVRGTLFPQATIITPNLPEAESLSGVKITDHVSSARCAGVFLNEGAKAVLIKGGHGSGEEVVDRLYTTAGSHKFTSQRLRGQYHGTGCSLSTAIACNLAKGASLDKSVELAHDYIADVLRHSAHVGLGSQIFDPLNRLEDTYGI